MKKMISRKKTKTPFKYLPLEIWTLILARMPGKTLLRFRSVCKPWCSIIDDPDFVHLHLQLCNTNNNSKNKLFVAFEVPESNGGRRCLMTIRRADTFRKTGHNLTSSQYYGAPGSCNGLFLMSQLVDKKRELRLWNPSIRKSLLVPSCPIPSHLKNRVAFVFGFAPSTKEYKILAITLDETPGTHPKDMFFAVYTLSDQRWSIRNNGFDVESSCFEHIFWSYFHPCTTVFLQGAVHSMAYNLYGDNKNHLISLDFDSEKFTILELPCFSNESYTMRQLLIVGESVAVFSISEVNTSIWVLKIDGGKRVWTLWFSKPSSRDEFDFFKHHLYSEAFYYESDYGGCLIIEKKSYNIASGQVKERGKSMRKYVKLVTYSESLVLHKGYGAQDDDDVFPVD
ncbi:F-box/kelch-repeat protein At3g23880-like isoform X2 [Silene latifolia]|uniref:F-box/kelch-repeat protein At3g23880-like isoform X2 n=1 Tax=Silene latifolia TaxID=37657 RepID=UPI003D7775A0